MESNGNGHQPKHQELRGFASPSALSSGADVSTEGCQEDFFWASEIMAVALEVTQTSTAVYEMVAEVARCSTVPPEVGGTAVCPPLRRHQARLQCVTAAIENTERRIRLLESNTATIRSEIFELFLEDCWAALATFKEVSERLTGIIGPNGSGDSSSTTIEILAQSMRQLEMHSEKVTELPQKGLAASYRCLAESSFKLQRRVRNLVGKVTGIS